MKKTYIGEMEWALQEINCRNHDQNPSRFAQVNKATQYGLEVAIARRSKDPIPPRPDLDKAY